MSIITIDFESYYAPDYSLSKMTTQAYVDCPRFEVIGLATKISDCPTHWISGSMLDILAYLKSLELEKHIVVAHNAMFDGFILSSQFGIHPKRFIDTLSMARAVHGTEVGGSLAKLAQHYELGEKGTEIVNALGKRRADFSPEELARYGEYCKNDVDLTYRLMKQLLPHFNSTELSLIDITIKMFTDPKLILNRGKLEEHLVEVVERKEKLLEECGISKDDLMSNLKLADVLMSLGVDPPMKISKATGKESYAFAKTDEEFKALLEHPDDRVQAIAAARMGVKSTLEEKRTQRLTDVASSRTTIPIALKYCGAGTTRWSAAEKLQFQNFPRKSKLKESIEAPEGYVIIGADLANIELRVNMFLAGQQEPLAILSEGRDLYREFGGVVFEVSPEDIDDRQRFISKTCVLGLGFGSGAKVLRQSIKTGSGIDIGEAESVRLVDTFRSTYPKVVESWGQGQRALNSIFIGRQEEYGLGSLRLPIHGQRGLRLPSGLYLKYPGLTKKHGDDGRMEFVYNGGKGKEKTRIYGPKFSQNVTQAVARCILGEMIPVIHAKYPVVLTIHDAIYCLAPEDEVEEAKAFVTDAMTTTPDWAWGLPLAVEVHSGRTLKDV